VKQVQEPQLVWVLGQRSPARALRSGLQA